MGGQLRHGGDHDAGTTALVRPGFFIMGGALHRPAVGAQSADLFMVIMTEVGLKAVLKHQAS